MFVTLVRDNNTNEVIARVEYNKMVEQTVGIGFLRHDYNNAMVERYYGNPNANDNPVCKYNTFN